MQNLTKLVEQLKRQEAKISDTALMNIIREYLQVLILKFVYRSKYGPSLSFMGGTSLRICYDLKRFSEDIDLALDRPARSYSFAGLIDVVCKELASLGYSVEQNVSEEKTVQKAFVKFAKILHSFGLSNREEHKIHIKIEVDTNPVKVSDDQMESFFVSKFAETFPILKHKLETAFAGKVLAILGREYTKGRDYYDLIWFLSRRTGIDMGYLNEGLKQRGSFSPVKDKNGIFELLDIAVEKAGPQTILKDIGRFLDDPTEEAWLRDYQRIYKQLSMEYLKLQNRSFL